MKISQMTFFGTVEHCYVDNKVVVLRFICEKIRDNIKAEEYRMPNDKMPMASIINVIQLAPDSLNAIRSMRKDDRIALTAAKWQDSSVTYEAANLTMRQKYQDVAVYVGNEASCLLSSDPHSAEERLLPAVFPS